MKTKIVLPTSLALVFSVAAMAHTQAATKYELTLTNGSQMPISPPVIYSKLGSESAAPIGSKPTLGFIEVCETGKVTARLNELKADASVKFITNITAPIMPGEAKVVVVEVADPLRQSVHFETMYGKTKDVCGIGTIASHDLVALKKGVTDTVILKDDTVLTDAFLDPKLPLGMAYLDPTVCPAAADATACLRELAVSNGAHPKIRFFAGYFPSLITALESKYGAADVQTLLFPFSGAIQMKLKLAP